jgi:hypothetical protein
MKRYLDRIALLEAQLKHADASIQRHVALLTCVSTPVPMRQRFWLSFRAGSRTTTRGIPTRGCG